MGWRARGALWALVGILVLSGCSGRAGTAAGGLPPGAVARVGAEVIAAQDFEEWARVIALYHRQGALSAQARSLLLDQMVEERLLVQEGRRQGRKVEPTRVDEEYRAFMAALATRYGGEAALQRRLQELRLSPATIRAFLADFLLAEDVRAAFLASVQVSDEEIRRFYEENKNTLYTFAEDVVRARHILLPSDREDLARQVLAQAQSGADFAALARDYSVDPGTGRVGGDLGYFPRSGLAPEIAAVAFALQPGQVGGPVKSQFGWHIIKVEDRRPPGTIPLEVARDDVANKLLLARRAEALARWIQDLKQAAGVQVASPAAMPDAVAGTAPDAGKK